MRITKQLKMLTDSGRQYMGDNMKKGGFRENSPTFGDNGIATKRGDNSKYASALMEIHEWGPVDRNDVEALEARFWKYVDYCAQVDLRVTNQVAYYAMGIDKKDIYDWEHGRRKTKAHADLAKKVRQFCASYREILGADGKINPVTLVWWQKNYDGMVDRQEIVVSPNDLLGELNTPQDLADRIAKSVPAALPGDREHGD